VTTHHGWAGSPALRAAVQSPPSARAGVVICPPLGQEGVIAYRTLRLLADRLEARGVASVRYDPSGRGDSAPDTDPDAQVRSAVRAAALLRTTGIERIAFVGLASAAVVAAAAATEDDGLVVWDAPDSGRAWLRRQRALASITVEGERVVDGVESIIGMDLAEDEAAALSALRFTPRTGATLALVRPGGRVPKALGDVASAEAPGSAELLDRTSVHARIPDDALDAVVAWVDTWAPTTTVPVTVPALEPLVDVDHRVSERVVLLGPERLFAIESVTSRQAPDAPVVVLHNGAAEHHVGSADYQVTLARKLARDGARVVRVDRRGTGESSVVRADERDYLFAQEWLDDQSAIVTALAAPTEQLVVVGMCAGAWIAGRAHEDAPRLVVEISPNDYRRRPALPGAYSDAVRAVDSPSPRRQWIRERYNVVVPKWLRDRIARRDRPGGVLDHVKPLVAQGTDVVVIVADGDAELFDRLGGQRALRRFPVGGRGGGVELVHVVDGDHALFAPAMRAVVIDEVRARVRAAFPVHA
jgi:alpha-beta hydrolase superfamily lysophospholipase